MYKLFIGCDMSKDFFDVSYYDSGEAVYVGQFDNCESGFNEMKIILKRTQTNESEWFICFETTGCYSKAFLYWLFDQQIACKEESALAIKRSIGIKRGKSDKADSKSICIYAYEKRERIKPSQPVSINLIKIKGLFSRRQHLVKLKVSDSNSAQSHKDKPEDVLNLIKQQNKELNDLICNQIKELDKQIREIIKSEKVLKKSFKLLISIIGIGPTCATSLIIWTNNFKKVTDPRKFACFIGAAPFDNSSGKYKGKIKTSKLGHRHLKSMYSNAAIAAIQHDPQIANYSLRKSKQGKQHGIIINNVINKLIFRAFAVINRGTPFVKLPYM